MCERKAVRSVRAGREGENDSTEGISESAHVVNNPKKKKPQKLRISELKSNKSAIKFHTTAEIMQPQRNSGSNCSTVAAV